MRNLLLATLSNAELESVQGDSTIVEFEALTVLAEAGDRVEHIYFPLTAVISVVRPLTDATFIETGTIGREGCAGISGLFGLATTDTRLEVQVPGACLVMRVAAFTRLLAEVPSFREAAGRFVSSLFDQVGQSVICSSRHSVPQRCARWLLMAHDRVDGDEFYLTHTTLARMLDVRRAGVTVAALVLKRAGLLNYRRGRVTILDRNGLEAAACECYAINRRHITLLYAGLHLTGVSDTADERSL